MTDPRSCDHPIGNLNGYCVRCGTYVPERAERRSPAEGPNIGIRLVGAYKDGYAAAMADATAGLLGDPILTSNRLVSDQIRRVLDDINPAAQGSRSPAMPDCAADRAVGGAPILAPGRLLTERVRKMRELQIVACSWCHKVIWPWQDRKRYRHGPRIHRECARYIGRLMEQDQTTGI